MTQCILIHVKGNRILVSRSSDHKDDEHQNETLTSFEETLTELSEARKYAIKYKKYLTKKTHEFVTIMENLSEKLHGDMN